MSSTRIMARRLSAKTLAAVLFVATTAAAQTPVPLLLEADWLKAHAGDPEVVVLHVGSADDFDRGHVPGARAVTENDLSLPHDAVNGGLMLELPAPEVLRRTLERLGISDQSHIVVYAGPATPLQSATRVLFTLDYLGLGERTSLLNGGVSAWTRAGGTLTSQSTRVVPGRLTAIATRDVVATAANVRAPGAARVIDARAPVFYRGLEARHGVKGHIPGALSIPFSAMADDEQRLDRGRLQQVFDAAGIRRGDSLIAYCHVGQQATAVVFAARLLGYPVKLYDGSFQEWVTRLDGPVEVRP